MKNNEIELLPEDEKKYFRIIKIVKNQDYNYIGFLPYYWDFKVNDNNLRIAKDIDEKILNLLIQNSKSAENYISTVTYKKTQLSEELKKIEMGGFKKNISFNFIPFKSERDNIKGDFKQASVNFTTRFTLINKEFNQHLKDELYTCEVQLNEIDKINKYLKPL